MNKKILTLAKALIKNSYSLPTDQKKKQRQALLLVFVALAFVPMIISLVTFEATMYDGLVLIGEQGVLLSLGIALSAFVIFFFGLFYTMNTFYFSEDIENLLPLPVKSSHILGAKFIVVTIFEYITECIVLLPLLVVYGIKGGQGPMFYVYGLLIFLTLPVLPIVLDSLVVMTIMRFTNLAKNKDAFRIVSAVIAICFGVTVNSMAQRLGFSAGTGQLPQLGNNSLVTTTTNIFPPAKLGALGLINSGSLEGLAYTGLFLLSSLLGFCIFLWIGNLLYYKGVTGVSVSTSHHKQISGEALSRQTVRNSVLKSYVLKELRILFRTPAYFINCILINFIWPILLIIPTLTRPKAVSDVSQLKGVLQSQGIGGIVVAVAVVIVSLVASSNGIASTSISREGESVQFDQYIPVNYKTQIMAKVFTGVIMGIVGMLAMGIAMVVLLKISPFLLLVICCTSLLGILFSNLIGVCIDLFNPKLHWSDEQRAVKQNLNLLFGMAISALVGGALILAVVKLKLTLNQAAFSIVIAYALLDALVYLGVVKKGSALFRQIQY